MRPLLAAESITGTAAFKVACASSCLPACTAASTSFIAVRIFERDAMLWARRFTACRARFSADLILATDQSSKGRRGAGKKRGAILPRTGEKGKGKWLLATGQPANWPDRIGISARYRLILATSSKYFRLSSATIHLYHPLHEK